MEAKAVDRICLPPFSSLVKQEHPDTMKVSVKCLEDGSTLEGVSISTTYSYCTSPFKCLNYTEILDLDLNFS